MATPIIQSTGSTSGAGTAGQGRKDLVIGETVTLSDTEAANSGATYLWSFIDIPIGSSATLNNPTTSTPDFSPDIEGSYWIRAVVDGTDTSDIIIAVALPNTDSRIPAFEEETEYNAGGNAKGWHEAMDFFMRAVDGGTGGGTLTITSVKTGNYTATANELVRVDPSGGAFTVTLPAVDGDNEGQSIVVKNTTDDNTAVTIDTTGADTIDGLTDVTLNVSRGAYEFVSDGSSDWMIV